MEIIKSEETEEIGIVLSKEEAEALGYALSRFTCHDLDTISKMVITYLNAIDIAYESPAFNAKYKRYFYGSEEVELFSIRVP